MSNNSKRANKQIRAKEVRLIDNEGENLGVIETQKALKKAQEKGLDLVEVQPGANPPVAKLLDYQKYKYEQKKKQKQDSKKKSHAGEMKQIRFKFQTSDNDLKIKARKVDEFLEEKYKVRVSVLLRGREKAHKDLARDKIEKFIEMLETDIVFEKKPHSHPRGLQFIIREE